MKLPNPRDQKMVLAEEITKLYHGEKAAASAKEAFISQFSKGELPEDMVEVKIKPGSYDVVELLVQNNMASSKSDARRLMDQNGIKVNQQTYKEKILEKVEGQELVLQAGKRKFVKLV